METIGGEGLAERDGSPAHPTYSVEVLLGPKADEIEDILRAVVKELGIIMEDELYKKVLVDMNVISKCSTKHCMMLQYSKILQKNYCNGDLTQETKVKCVLKVAVPRLIERQFSWMNVESKVVNLTSDDRKVVMYLAGATLRWGLSRFKGEDNIWCRNQVCPTASLPEEFQSRNRGTLIMPVENYFHLLYRVECKFRRQLPCRLVNIQTIIRDTEIDRYYPQSEEKIVEMMIKKYVRGRAHMHCRTISVNKFNMRPIAPKSASLRDTLKK